MAKLTLQRISKSFDGHEIVPPLDLAIDDGEFMVLVGPSGCGKSTLLRMIAGLETPTAGEIYLNDKLLNPVPPKNRGVAMVFQNYALYPHMTVKKNLSFGLIHRKMSKAEIEGRVTEAARLLEIGHLMDRLPKTLSGGQKQRVAIGRAIVRHPEVFLFDEPLSNLDAKLRIEMRREIRALHRRLKTTTVYVTHDQIEAMSLGTRICVMRDGLIQQVGTPLEVYNEPANLFVAGFIGTIPMNFIHGLIRREGDEVYFTTGDEDFKLPLMVKGELPSGMEDIVLGVRPKHIVLDDQTAPKITARVVTNEVLGDRTIVHCEVNGSRFSFESAMNRKIDEGTVLKLSVNPARCHFFGGADDHRLPGITVRG